MRGPDPRIHHLRKTLSKRMDCRVKPGNDDDDCEYRRFTYADEYIVYPDLASAPSIIATAFGRPYTATNDPKRGPFSWPSST